MSTIPCSPVQSRPSLSSPVRLPLLSSHRPCHSICSTDVWTVPPSKHHESAMEWGRGEGLCRGRRNSLQGPACHRKEVYFAILVVNLDDRRWPQSARLQATRLREFSVSGPRKVYSVRSLEDHQPHVSATLHLRDSAGRNSTSGRLSGCRCHTKTLMPQLERHNGLAQWVRVATGRQLVENAIARNTKWLGRYPNGLQVHTCQWRISTFTSTETIRRKKRQIHPHPRVIHESSTNHPPHPQAHADPTPQAQYSRRRATRLPHRAYKVPKVR